MKTSYMIRGTISVYVNGKQPEIWIIPSTGFLTPDKQKVIAFPVPSSKGKTNSKAEFIGSANDKQFKFKAKCHIRDNIPALLAAAAQQKPLELRLDPNLKIVGFVFPAPSDHAHGR